MKVYIGPYVDRWISNVHDRYMMKKYGYDNWPETQTRFENLLEKYEDTLQWVYNHSINLYLDRKERKVRVKLHRYDTWGMDDTLAPIILPMLVQLKETKHGAPIVDNEDVPKHLHMTKKEKEAFNRDGSTTDKFFERWDWVMDEMIWAFEQKTIDWEEQYYGEWVEDETQPLGGYSVGTDYDGIEAHQKRMSNGFRLFGKYYESLWD